MAFKPITHDPLIITTITTNLEDRFPSSQKNAVKVYMLHVLFELGKLNLDNRKCQNRANGNNFLNFNR